MTEKQDPKGCPDGQCLLCHKIKEADDNAAYGEIENDGILPLIQPILDEMKAAVPQLKTDPIQVGEVIGQKIDYETGNSYPIYYTEADAKAEAERNKAKYIKECQAFFQKWLGAP